MDIPKELRSRIVCPKSRQALEWLEDGIQSANGEYRYSLVGDIPDLRHQPSRVVIEHPWYDPFNELDSLDLTPPPPLVERDLPYHLDPHLAGVAGNSGNGRTILEIGCGERQCEKWFSVRGFKYLGIDVDVRGQGPHILADAHSLPFSDESFDLCTSMAVYEHLSCPMVAARETSRVLKPGGLFFGSSAFMYGFHDRASFFHMSHAGLLCLLSSAGFRVKRIWCDWDFHRAIPEMAYRGGPGAPWRYFSMLALRFAEQSFLTSSRIARSLTRSRPLDTQQRMAHMAGSLSFIAVKES